MKTDNEYLNSLFNNTSSIYQKNQGMLNSNLYVLWNAYAQVFKDLSVLISGTHNNTYLNLADHSVLEANFSPMVNFEKPPRLNTLENGDEIYRAILKSLYDAFLNGSTEDSMDTGLSTVLSFLITDTVNTGISTESDRVLLYPPDTFIQLPFDALTSSGTVATINDFTISPSGYWIITGYDSATRTLNFSGSNVAANGMIFEIDYYRDYTSVEGTNWINFTNQSEIKPVPLDLKTFENTFQNKKFSYWWNTYNRDGNGVQIIDGALSASDTGLVWRLPSKSIRYKNPYDEDSHDASIDAYDLSGSAYDINNTDKVLNLDVLQKLQILDYSDVLQKLQILDYSTEVSSNPNEYFIRYSNNNSQFEALSKFLGTWKDTVSIKGNYVKFANVDSGTLDFFEKGTNFDGNDLFGTGTKHIWLNVPNVNGYYILNDNYIFDRKFSLHEKILFRENFQSGKSSLDRFHFSGNGSQSIHDMIGVPLSVGEDCLQLIPSGVDNLITSHPIISSTVLTSGNHIEIDFFDSLPSLAKSYIDLKSVNVSNPISNSSIQLRFGIDEELYFDEDNRIIGISGDTISNTKKDNYVETYFPNYSEADYALILPSGNYELTSGNVYTSYSNYYLHLSGNASVYPNMTPDLIENVNKLGIKFGNTSSGPITITIKGIVPNPSNPNNYTYREINYNFTSNYLLPVYWGYYQSNGIDSSTNGGAIPSIRLNAPGTPNVFEWNKNSNITLNGVQSSYSFAPSDFIYATRKSSVLPGRLYTIDDFNLYNNECFQILAITPGNSPFYYYFLGNSQLASIFNTSQLMHKSYFYQTAYSGNNIEYESKNYLSSISREYGWHKLIVDYGTSGNKAINSYIDEYRFLNQTTTNLERFGTVGSVGNSEAISLNHIVSSISGNYAFFDNVNLSYYDPITTNPEYNYLENSFEDFQGSYLDQSTILYNRVFEGDRQASFTFELILRGLIENYLFVIRKIVDNLKPAHTLTEINIQTDHEINTTSTIPQFVGRSDNWENGNIINKIQINSDLKTSDLLDLSGAIKPSGT